MACNSKTGSAPHEAPVRHSNQFTEFGEPHISDQILISLLQATSDRRAATRICEQGVTLRSKFVLKFFICQACRLSFQFGDDAHPIKATDPQLALVPYIAELQAPEYAKWFLGGFLQSESAG